MAKQILFDDTARHKMKAGIEKLAKTVRITMGPSGRNVILQKSFGSPHVTKDGVSVAKEIELEDPFENMGAKLVLEVANKTNDIAGDGTTTATVLAASIFSEGMKFVANGVSTIELRNGINKAVEIAVASIVEQSRKVKSKAEKVAIATISANNNPEVGAIIANAFEAVGDTGVVTVEENTTLETTLEVVEGMEFDKGYLSPYFATNLAKLTCEFENPYILICNKKISSVREFIPALEAAAHTGHPLLVIAEDVEGEALTALVINRLKGILNVCAVKAPGFGDRRKAYLEDIATLTGGTALTEDIGVPLEKVTMEHFGQAGRVVISKDSTTIVQGKGKPADIKARTKQIQAQIDASTSDYDKEKLEERLAKLTGGVAMIKVGGKTEAEMKQMKDLVEDALNATRAATQEGIVPGGGVALLRASLAVAEGRFKGDEKFGATIIERALGAPVRQIAENAGADGSVVAETILEKGKTIGYNALTGVYEDMFKAGVIDPAKVVRTALQNAASIAGLLLTTDSMVTDLKDDADPIEGVTS
ncbi:MAG: chaperonin GroEL [Planctomycetes bacterium]|nr:chaperonin GroEL [Planctomycetota bacterium]MCB9909466.1 chaperonin GroEL [Planctomycetota bacterium]HPF13576.1 chaperonin GroEL [Planctomycetota bacterium]